MPNTEENYEDDLPLPGSEPSQAAFETISKGGFSPGEKAEKMIDLGSALGASIDLSPQVLRLYIPNKDRNGRRIWWQRKWVNEAAGLLATLGGGVTIMPPLRGGWFDPARMRIVWERPVIVYTFVKPDLFVPRLGELREFLHRLGRETEQGEIAFEFDGDLYRIYNYDS
jgi:hypothetical protein